MNPKLKVITDQIERLPLDVRLGALCLTKLLLLVTDELGARLAKLESAVDLLTRKVNGEGDP